MKSVWKRVLSVVMVLCMLVSVAPVTVLAVDAEETDSAVTAEATEPAVQETVDAELQEPAEEPTVDAEQPEPTEEPVEETEEPAADLPEEPITEDTERGSIDGIYWRNPLYPDQGKSAVKYNSNGGDPITGELSPNVFNALRQTMLQELQSSLINHKAAIYLYHRTDFMLTEEYVFELFEDAVYSAVGNDYLLFSILDYYVSVEYAEYDGKYYNIIVYEVNYLTTKEQEDEFTDVAGQLANELKKDTYNDYQRCKKLYDYICEKVSYDFEHTADPEYVLQHSAYAALIHGKASAQGFAMLFHFLARRMDLDNRIVIGTVEGVPFAWNIVKLYDRWYNLDIALDAETDTYDYFLKGSADFTDHVRDAYYDTEEFQSKQPMSDSSFDSMVGQGQLGDNLTWTYNADTATLTISGQGPMVDLVYYQEVGGFCRGDQPWRSYTSEGAYYVVDDGVTSLGNTAFFGTNILGIEIAQSVKHLGEMVFRQCVAPKIEFPEGITEIPKETFKWSFVPEIKLPDSVVHIGESAFESNYELTEITLPKELVSIGAKAFFDTKLTEIAIPAKVTTIAAYAFGCETLRSYTVDPNNTVFSSSTGALYNKDQSVLIKVPIAEPEEFVFADNVAVIGEEAFGGCQWVDVIKLPDGVTTIKKNAFMGTNLVSIELPETLTTLEEEAFGGEILYCVYIPASLTEIPANTFVYGYVQNYVYYGGTQEQWNSLKVGEGNGALDNATLLTNTRGICGSYTAYGPSWTMNMDTGVFEFNTPYGIGTDDPSDYEWAPWKDQILTVTITENPESIWQNMFMDCKNLKTVTIPSNIKEISDTAFAGCSTLTDVYTDILEEDWHNNGFDAAFSALPNVTVHFPVGGYCGSDMKWSYNDYTGKLTVSGMGVMENYSAENPAPWSEWSSEIVIVELVLGITSVGDYAFNGCALLQEIELPETVTSIGANAFSDCTKLEKLTIPASVTSIGSNAFSGCTALTEVSYVGNRLQWNAVKVDEGNDLLKETVNCTVAVSFSDVSDADYFYLPVQWAVENNVTGGIGNNMFGPHNSCTRGQVVTFLWAAAGKPEPTSKDNPFNDVSEADYYYKPVLWAVENGITGGIGEGLFGPNESCTRGQIVTFLWAAMDKPEVSGTSSFSDVADTDWYAKPVLWAVENGITGGIGNNQFGPNNTCTRGQVVTFLYKVYNK